MRISTQTEVQAIFQVDSADDLGKLIRGLKRVRELTDQFGGEMNAGERESVTSTVDALLKAVYVPPLPTPKPDSEDEDNDE